MQNKLDQEYWDNRYNQNLTGWDIGYPSTPLKEYFDQLSDKNIRILIPGGGNSYEAEYLFKQGFTNVFVLDISPVTINQFKLRCPEFPADNIFCEDFFHHKAKYDLIVEQTFFCALDPLLREKYVEKMSELLNKKGKLVGVLFDREFNGGPPFGGNKAEYEELFSKQFTFLHFEECYNSISPRKDTEIFISLLKE